MERCKYCGKFSPETGFSVGDVVKASEAGMRGAIFKTKNINRLGRVVAVDRFNAPKILWDGLKNAAAYHPDFVSLAPKDPNDV